MPDCPEMLQITPDAPISNDRHGNRAKCLQRLVRLDLPVPLSVALSFDTVRGLAKGHVPDIARLAAIFDAGDLLSVRSSSEAPDWGGPGTVLNIGMNDAVAARIAAEHGQAAADQLYLSFIRSYAVDILRLDEDLFAGPISPRTALAHFEDEMEEPFPQDTETQLTEVLRSMARAWEGTSTRLLRQAKGAPADAGLGLVVQRMAISVGGGETGAGVVQFVSSETGEPQITGRYLPQSQGRAALREARAQFIESDPRGVALEDRCPDQVAALREAGRLIRMRLRDEMQIEFTLMEGRLAILDAVNVPRSARAEVRIAVDLAEEGVIPATKR